MGRKKLLSILMIVMIMALPINFSSEGYFCIDCNEYFVKCPCVDKPNRQDFSTGVSKVYSTPLRVVQLVIDTGKALEIVSPVGLKVRLNC